MKKLTSIILIAVMTAAIIPSFAIPTEVNANPVEINSRVNSIINLAPQLTPASLEYAFGVGLTWFAYPSRHNFGHSGNMNFEIIGTTAMFYLAYAAHLDPETRSTAGVLASDRALAHIRHIISGGREFHFDSGPFLATGVLPNAILMMRKTPVIWDQLEPEEVEKIDLLMEAAAIIANWGFNDSNNYFTGLSMRGNFNKSWNPNFRVKGIAAIVAASMYFGGADELNAILAAFDHATFMQRLLDAGFTTIHYVWSGMTRPMDPDIMMYGGRIPGPIHLAPSGQGGGIGAGVRVPFVYHGYTLDEIPDIVYRLLVGGQLSPLPAPPHPVHTLNQVHRLPGTYQRIVQNGWTRGSLYTYTLGGASSPFLGQMGAFYEFYTNDGSGFRSDAMYGYMSMQVIVPFMINLAMFYDGWDGTTPRQQQVHRQIHVGHEDLIFKLYHGFRSWSHGGGRVDVGHQRHAYRLVKDLWRMALGFHNTPTTIATAPGFGLPLQMSPPRFSAVNVTPAGASGLRTMVNGWNHSNEPLETTIILAMFDENGVFLRAFRTNVSIPAGTGMFSNRLVSFGSPAPTIPPGTRYVQTFVWDNLSSMTPLF